MKAARLGKEVGPPIFGTAQTTEDAVDTAARGKELRLVTCIQQEQACQYGQTTFILERCGRNPMEQIWSRRYVAVVQELAKLETDHSPVLFLFCSIGAASLE